jgi:CheY-like chemotaxis protein
VSSSIVSDEPLDLGLLLIAEDNLADVGLIRMALERYHLLATVHLVRDGEAAVRFVDQVERDHTAACPTLAVLDLNLPRISGDQILLRLRSSTRWSDVPVIVMSSSLSAKDRTQAMNSGATSYFSKPSDLEHFLELGALIKDVAMAKDLGRQ